MHRVSGRANDRGVALILVLIVMLTMSTLGMALALMTSTETRVSAAYRDGLQVLYATDAAVERALYDLGGVADINSVLSGLTTSTSVDGAPGVRRLPDGTSLDLGTLTAMVTCGAPACSDADLDALREDRPWGSNNPRWQLFAYGPVSPLPVYRVVWIADDPSETDGEAMTDGGEVEGGENPGRGRIALLAHGYGPGGTRRIIEATAVVQAGRARLISWREIR